MLRMGAATASISKWKVVRREGVLDSDSSVGDPDAGPDEEEEDCRQAAENRHDPYGTVSVPIGVNNLGNSEEGREPAD
jgi:hypothetical protein